MRFADETGTWFSVVPAVEPLSADGEALVEDVRDLDSPFDGVLVGGQSAAQVDTKDVVFERLPWAIGLVAVTTFVVLFMLFGSLLVPLKALVLNFLSLTATFGAMVFIFQDGNGSGLLDFTATGDIAVAMPILMFCIAFGLSMDYEVFLLSRIKEEHDRGSDTVTSVAVGLERTGRIVTAAAVLIAVVFLAFATGQVSFMKMFGIGLTLAVLVDAFLIRSTLVPAFMRLAGDANWWAPGPLRRFHDRFGFSEHVDLDDELAELTALGRKDERVLARGRPLVTSVRGSGLAAARATSSARRSSPRSASCSTRPTTRRPCRSAPSPSELASRHRRSTATSPTRTRCSAPCAPTSSPSCRAASPARWRGPRRRSTPLPQAGRCYVEFGLAHPEHYRLVFMRPPVDAGEASSHEEFLAAVARGECDAPERTAFQWRGARRDAGLRRPPRPRRRAPSPPRRSAAGPTS